MKMDMTAHAVAAPFADLGSRREYDVETVVGQPQVNYRETITKKMSFNYLHKKQTGGSGQFARVMGFIEPIPENTRDSDNELVQFQFQNRVLGATIPPEYISSVEKGKRHIIFCTESRRIKHEIVAHVLSWLRQHSTWSDRRIASQSDPPAV